MSLGSADPAFGFFYQAGSRADRRQSGHTRLPRFHPEGADYFVQPAASSIEGGTRIIVCGGRLPNPNKAFAIRSAARHGIPGLAYRAPQTSVNSGSASPDQTERMDRAPAPDFAVARRLEIHIAIRTVRVAVAVLSAFSANWAEHFAVGLSAQRASATRRCRRRGMRARQFRDAMLWRSIS